MSESKTNEMSEPVGPDPARLRSLHDRGLTPDQIRRLTPEQITRSRYFPGPNTYTLTLPRRFKCSPTVNVDRLKPYHPRAGRADPPGPVLDPGQEGEYVVEQLLNRKTLRGRTYYLVRWQGHASATDSWEPVEHLAHCPERVAEYEAAAPRRPKTLRSRLRAGGGPYLWRRPLLQSRPPPWGPPRPFRPRIGPWWGRHLPRCWAP